MRMKQGNLDIGGSANLSTARTGTSPSDEATRAQRAADARGLLAAIVLERHGINPRTATLADLPDAVRLELREVAMALGVDGMAQRKPGYCLCGQALHITATSHQTGRQLRGRCKDCSRAEREARHG